MLIKRTAIRLLALAAFVLLASRAMAQPSNSNLQFQSPTPSWENGSAPYSDDNPTPGGKFLPFHPMSFEPTFEPFAPAETSGYGNGPRPHIGYWGSYERVFWSLSKPPAAFVGSTTAQPPLSVITTLTTPPVAFPNRVPSPYPDGPTVDNDFIAATGAWGNRWELGYVDSDNYGWMASVLDHISQGQYRIAQNPLIGFDDPSRTLHGITSTTGLVGTTNIDIGEIPTPFAFATMKNVLELNGVEAMRVYRAPQLHNGGYFTLLYGARWLQINDTFFVQAFGNGPGTTSEAINGGLLFGTSLVTFPQNILDASSWSTRANNSIVGPQIGGRWERQRGRWVTSLELRAMAGANFLNITQKSNLGTMALVNKTAADSNVIIPFVGLGTNNHQTSTIFAPAGEIRFQTVFQIAANVGLKIGYTGLVVANVARASDHVDYGAVNLIGIVPGPSHHLFFANGLNLGLEFNR
jgi:hypothetical protein